MLLKITNGTGSDMVEATKKADTMYMYGYAFI